MQLKFFLMTLMLLMSTILMAQPTGYTQVESATLAEEMKKYSEQLTAIASDFVQEKTMAYLDEVIISKGKFWYKQEDFLRWQYNEPFEYVIAIKEGSFSIKDQGKVKVFDTNSNPAFKELNDMILSIAKGTLIQDNRFQVEAFENHENYFIRLTPKDLNMKKFIQQTDLYVSKEDGVATQVIMYESESDFTSISFVNRQINHEISDSIFDIK